MLDTVILNIPRDRVHDAANLNGMRPWDLQARNSMYEKRTRNPPRGINDGVYRPRLTGITRNARKGELSSFLKIEFSVPKLLLGNNLEEVTEKDFPLAVDTLCKRLIEAGCVVQKQDIANASVAAFHPSKNIALSGGYTASLVSSEIAKINLNKKFDLQKTSFRNGGQSLQGYTLAHSIVIYDKIADLAQTKKRAIDKDPAPGQLSLFQQLKTEKPLLEVLRLEIRLTHKQKINGLLKRLGFPTNPTFEQIFKKDICQKIVQSYWKIIIEGENLFLFGTEDNPKNLIKRLFRQHPKIRTKDAIYLVGLNTLCKDGGGVRDLRAMLEKKQSRRGWYRIAESINLLNKDRVDRHLHGWVQQVRNCLNDFDAYRIQPP